MDHVILTSSIMVRAANLLEVPCIATEQNPSKLGALCGEITSHKDISNMNDKNFKCFSKMVFSMTSPEVWDVLNKMPERKQAVLFGLEAHVCVFQTALDLIEKVRT